MLWPPLKAPCLESLVYMFFVQHLLLPKGLKTFQKFEAPATLSQHCWAQHTARVWPPSCDMLGVVSSSLQITKLFIQHLWMLHYVALV